MIYIRKGENLPSLCLICAKHFMTNSSVNVDARDRHGEYEPNYKNYSK